MRTMCPLHAKQKHEHSARDPATICDPKVPKTCPSQAQFLQRSQLRAQTAEFIGTVSALALIALVPQMHPSTCSASRGWVGDSWDKLGRGRVGASIGAALYILDGIHVGSVCNAARRRKPVKMDFVKSHRATT